MEHISARTKFSYKKKTILAEKKVWKLAGGSLHVEVGRWQVTVGRWQVACGPTVWGCEKDWHYVSPPARSWGEKRDIAGAGGGVLLTFYVLMCKEHTHQILPIVGAY